MVTAVAKICDPGLYPLKEAIQRARDNIRDSPEFEQDLSRFLQAQCLSNHVPMQTVFRGLDILGGMRDGGTLDESTLTALLRPFLGSSDPRIASKCVLVLERQPRSITWLNRVMRETDDRVRANLIESIWTLRDPAVELVLRSAARDRYPRVAANAVYGLYLLGTDAWVEGLERLLGSDDAMFRKSGIWMLKTSGVPGAPARLKLLIRDADPGVRSAAFGALVHLRERGSKIAPVAAAAEVSA
jgi:HEAT repeat protein